MDDLVTLTLAGRTAVVTGAGGPIGAAIAVGLAAAGAAVALNHHPDDPGTVAATVAGIVDAGGAATAVAADITDEWAVLDMVTAVTGELGSPTILVNNAATRWPALLTRIVGEPSWPVTAVTMSSTAHSLVMSAATAVAAPPTSRRCPPVRGDRTTRIRVVVEGNRRAGGGESDGDGGAD